jgi:hypothetical protein
MTANSNFEGLFETLMFMGVDVKGYYFNYVPTKTTFSFFELCQYHQFSTSKNKFISIDLFNALIILKLNFLLAF